MVRENEQPWIVTGYGMFANEGPKGLKIEVISRAVGKSKSSFYHHFADLDVFTELLLDYHRERAISIADKERRCKNVIPDLINVLVDVKQDLLFNRQLRINRDVLSFRVCFEKVSKQIGEAVSQIWAEMLGLTDKPDVAHLFLTLSLESFYLQLTEETITYDWLVNYMNELKAMIKALQNDKSKK